MLKGLGAVGGIEAQAFRALARQARIVVLGFQCQGPGVRRHMVTLAVDDLSRLVKNTVETAAGAARDAQPAMPTIVPDAIGRSLGDLGGLGGVAP